MRKPLPRKELDALGLPVEIPMRESPEVRRAELAQERKAARRLRQAEEMAGVTVRGNPVRRPNG